jgi:opacity protein-like surface antigen
MGYPMSLRGNTQRFLLLLTLCQLLLSTFAINETEAGFLGRFSLSTAEEYSDNILFSEKKESDFVTVATPTLSFAYKPSWQTVPNLTASLSTSAEFFAQHSNLNNFGDNLRANVNYSYPYSPRLDFTLIDRLERRGQSRLDDSGGLTGGSRGSNIGGGGGLGGGSGLSGIGGLSGLGELTGFGMSGSTACRGSGSVSRGSGSVSSSLSQGDLLSSGERLENQIGVNGNFRYTSKLTFRGGYCWDYTAFIGEGGQETAHSINLEASYLWSPQTQLHARYTPSLIRSRDGQDNIVHDFDLGGDFLKLRQIHLTPTLIASASTGIAVLTGNGTGNSNSGSGKIRLENKLDADITKIWETASFRAGVRRGITSSLGVSGPSYTTSFFGHFTVNLTQRLIGRAGVEYSLYDTGDTKFKTLQTLIGLQYPLTNAISIGLGYSYNQLDPGSGAANNTILAQGKTSTNTAFVFFSMMFDIWPNMGLSRAVGSSLAGAGLTSSSSRSARPRTP